MDIYQIRYFLAIAETGGFTKAAERLFVSQPSLSTGIKKLEQELGVILKSVRLTELDGQPYIDRINCRLRSIIKQQFEVKRIQHHVVYRADNEDWVIALVAAGLGITVMADWRNLPGITHVPIADWRWERTLGLVWRTGQDNESVQAFCKFAIGHNWQ